MAQFDQYKSQYPQLAEYLSSRCNIVSFRKAGTKTFLFSLQMPKAWQGAMHRIKFRMQLRKIYRGSSEGRRISLPSTKTRLTVEGAGDFSRLESRRPWRCISESASTQMASILNGLSLSKVRPFGSGFLIFSDYARPAIRLSALMGNCRSSTFSRTTRSGVGEDGPDASTSRITGVAESRSGASSLYVQSMPMKSWKTGG